MAKINMGLTFYGGVSLAVYEAGVAEEFIRFIQFCKERSDDENPVDIKVISGTSAGGLAAVLMSAALVNASDPSLHIEKMRQIWFDVADLSRLQYKRGKDVVSFLDNDILETEVEDFLRLKQDPAGKALCKDLKILITGTNMQGFFDAVPVEHEYTDKYQYAKRAFPTIRHTEVFEFDRDYIREAYSNEDRTRRMAKAARITSSFPAAFPPQFTLSPSFPMETIEWYKTGRHSRNALHFWYFDGGVLDNKPLGHAIDHMQSSRAEGEWMYFFVEPKPQEYVRKHKEWGENPLEPPDPVATAAAALEARGAETIYYDLRRIQKINHQVMQINRLVPDFWNMCCSQHQDMPDDYIYTLEENVKTSRVHRFLPDYLKCVTMIKHNFPGVEPLEDERAGFDDIHEYVIENIRPLDLPRIISECRLQILEERIFKGERYLDLRERIKMTPEFDDSDVLKKYSECSQVVRKAQLLFRQISFRVELDYKTKKELSGETRGSFHQASDNIKDALHSLQGAYADVLSAIGNMIGDDDILKKIRYFVVLNESVHAASGVNTREKINVVKIYHNNDIGPLAGARIANFAGFLDQKWRRNDYLMGMQDARQMLEGKMDKSIFTAQFWSDYDSWKRAKENGLSAEYRLDKSTDIINNQAEMDLYNLSAGNIIPQVNCLLKTTGKLISKYRDKFVFGILKKISWLLPLFRGILWIIRHATAQPQCKTCGEDVSTMARFTSQGRRYLGFIGLGIILGLLISFFLPDFFGDAFRWLWLKIKSIY